MKPITIIGGGLAGLTLGIALRQRGIPASIHEAGSYPRHRVCGEFISGAGLQTLRELSLLQKIESLNARWAETTSFYGIDLLLGRFELPSPALCVSRWQLDKFLAEEFQTSGGRLVVHDRVAQAQEREGIIWSTGRNRTAARSEWFGVKAHVTNVELEADLEMHIHREGYVGLCRHSDGIVNVCGLLRKGHTRNAGIKELLQGQVGSVLRHRLERAAWNEESMSAVAAIPIGWPTFRKSDACTLGDAFSMIPPVTGNGMSVAFESAQLAVGPLTDYASGAPWAKTVEAIYCACKRDFAFRLRTAALLHYLLFLPGQRYFWSLLRSRSLWGAIFSATRSRATVSPSACSLRASERIGLGV